MTTKFDLTYEVFESDSLICKLGWNADLFDRSTIERMLKHFRHLLENFPDGNQRHFFSKDLIRTARSEREASDALTHAA